VQSGPEGIRRDLVEAGHVSLEAAAGALRRPLRRVPAPLRDEAGGAALELKADGGHLVRAPDAEGVAQRGRRGDPAARSKLSRRAETRGKRWVAKTRTSVQPAPGDEYSVSSRGSCGVRGLDGPSSSPSTDS
jgi:hypothetical protein